MALISVITVFNEILCSGLEGIALGHMINSHLLEHQVANYVVALGWSPAFQLILRPQSTLCRLGYKVMKSYKRSLICYQNYSSEIFFSLVSSC